MKDALKGATQLLLATDEDREGESISWHLLQILSLKYQLREWFFMKLQKRQLIKL